MRLFDAKSSHWAIRHIYVVMAAVGAVMIALSYPIGYYWFQSSDTTLDGGDVDIRPIATLIWSILIVGSGLLIISPMLALGYVLIRRGVKFENLKLKGSNVA